MDNCIFCKIINKEIPNYTVYEDDYVLAFLDIHPCCKGHTVVIPKKHVQSIVDISAEEMTPLAEGLRRAAKHVQEILLPEGMNIGLNDRPTAGQAVPHLHWHILPRWANDGGGNMHSIVRSGEGIDVSALAVLFK